MSWKGKAWRYQTGFVGRSVAVALTALLACLLSPVPTAPAGVSEATAYILSNQKADGGFCEPGRGEAGQEATTAWCVMALSAAGMDPDEVRPAGRSPLDFLASQSSSWRSVTDYERVLLAVVAGGRDPHDFGGVDLVAKISSYQRPGGNIGDAVNSNAFGILAYRAAGLKIPEGAVAWQRRAQNGDGGWGNSPGAASNPDMTAASLMALAAAGVGPGDPDVREALSFLRSTQNPDGGFAFQSQASDAAATAWCVQALVAMGQDPNGADWSKEGNTPWGFLVSMQAADGHFVWMRGRDMNPLWTTAYAVCALARKPYPVAVVSSPPPAGSGDGEAVSPPVEEAGGRETPAGEDSGDDGREDERKGEVAVPGGEEVAGGGDAPPAEGPTGVALEEGAVDGAGDGGGVPLVAWLLPLLGFTALFMAAALYFAKARPGTGGRDRNET